MVPPIEQKSFHGIINEITVNPSNKIEERSIKNAELFFDTSLKNRTRCLPLKIKRTIAKELFNEEYPTPGQIAGKKNATDKWHGSTVRLILENPHYTGDLPLEALQIKVEIIINMD